MKGMLLPLLIVSALSGCAETPATSVLNNTTEEKPVVKPVESKYFFDPDTKTRGTFQNCKAMLKVDGEHSLAIIDIYDHGMFVKIEFRSPKVVPVASGLMTPTENGSLLYVGPKGSIRFEKMVLKTGMRVYMFKIPRQNVELTSACDEKTFSPLRS
ncbi:hypothetical protein M977_00069 [Buttiauxella gaviniae ATCC 51604]|uniref:Lipoprotein n=1 Tax=Buttiauxella gaviniae ATCC 51604 TaxID=1354253 RepID=A0A1B7I754_9ENTR|nr:hypothetical protein [Buttiauxella gaviniae]OAT24238.1 hypothetical protein M977_00069 [Buttiauxella gaviniae ATCC 51604]